MFGLTMLLFMIVLFFLLIISSSVGLFIIKEANHTYLERIPTTKKDVNISTSPRRMFFIEDVTESILRFDSGRLYVQQYLLFDNYLDIDYETMRTNMTVEILEGDPFSSMIYSCLFTPKGIEYEGRRHYTESKNTCINWNNPLLYEHLNIKPFKSKDFPDESIENASSCCRNPDNSPMPWCFRKEDRKRENCSITYCERENCTVTGPGLEYKGFVNVSSYGDCEPWSVDVPFENFTLAKAYLVKNFCSNPTYDLSGPYCYVHEPYHDYGVQPWLRKSYCDIPLCDVYYNSPTFNGELYFRKRGPYLFCAIGDVGYYTHYTLINNERNFLNVSLKLWDPASVFNDQVRIVLSVLPIPISSNELSRWNIGFEIALSNNKTGVINPPEDYLVVSIPGFLSGIRWTHLVLEWDEQGISVNITQDEESTSIFYFRKHVLADTIRGLFRNKLQYFSVLGAPALMRIIIPDGGECEEQITTEEIYARFYPFFREGSVKMLKFAVRSKLPSLLLMRVSPLNNSSPEVIISMDGRSVTQLILRTYEYGVAGRVQKEEILQEANTFGDILFLNYTFFSLDIRGPALRLSVLTSRDQRFLFDFKSIHFNTLKYYSIASVSVAHWTLGCHPGDVKLKKFLPPNKNRRECSTTINDLDYMGQISISEKGRSCLPWISDFPTPFEKTFVSNKTYDAVNYCRNVNDMDAAYCYVYDSLTNRTVRREYCLIPTCKPRQCRTYGNGVGNLLNLTTTISGRQCKYWNETDEKFKAMFPHLDNNASHLRQKLLDINLSENFCRNPNNEISGPWCSTTDPKVEVDSCLIPDCDRPSETITLLTNNVKHETYIKPLWRISGWKFWTKRWERNIDAGLILRLLSASRREYFELIFEGKNNSHLVLTYTEEEKPVEVERFLPYDFYLFIPNNWSGYHLTLRPERLILGIVGEAIPFLNWEYSFMFDKILGKDPSRQFTPQFLTYEKTNGGVLAMSFDPRDPFAEVLTPEDQGTYYPITYGKRDSLMAYLPANLALFYFRGEGNVLISFYNTISTGPEMIIELGSGESKDGFVSKMYVEGKEITLETNKTDGPSILTTKWTEFRMIMIEDTVSIYVDDDQLSVLLPPRPFLGYYFKLQTSGNITWITNNNPPDLDGKSIDGGWSEWTGWECSATCGGGRGHRERLCTSPAPSFFGKPCPGEPVEHGICNDFDCEDLPPGILDAMKFRLKTYVHTLTVYRRIDQIMIECYPDILEVIQDNYPDSWVFWDKDGVPISNRTPIKDIDPHRYNIYKPKAGLSDTGVYTCAVRTSLISGRAIKVTSVIVKTVWVYTFEGYRGEVYKLQSNNLVLHSLYKRLEQTWYHDNEPAFSYIEKYMPLVNIKEIILEMNHSGEWECTIRNLDFDMVWHTNWLRIKVKYRREYVKYLMEDNKYTKHIFKNFKPIFVEITFVITVLLVTVLSMGLAYLLVLGQRVLLREWNLFYESFQTKMQARYGSPDEKENTESSPSSSLLSSAYEKYIQGDKDHKIYYMTDRITNDSEDYDHLGFRPTRPRRKLLTDVAPVRKHRRLQLLRSTKKGRTHRKSKVRRSPTKLIDIKYRKIRNRYKSEDSRFRLFHNITSTSSSGSPQYYDPDLHRSLDLLNYRKTVKSSPLANFVPRSQFHREEPPPTSYKPDPARLVYWCPTPLFSSSDSVTSSSKTLYPISTSDIVLTTTESENNLLSEDFQDLASNDSENTSLNTGSHVLASNDSENTSLNTGSHVLASNDSENTLLNTDSLVLASNNSENTSLNTDSLVFPTIDSENILANIQKKKSDSSDLAPNVSENILLQIQENESDLFDLSSNDS